MKVERTKSREYKGKSYHKYRVIIPERIMGEAGFKEGDELQAETKNGEIKLRKKS